jgi:cobalt-zinc-cadmium efflux system membrane fusion protein
MTLSRISLLTIFLFCLVACGPKKNAEQEKPTSTDVVRLTDEQRNVAGITLVSATRKTMSHTVKATGLLDVPPQNLIDVSAPLGGFVRNTSLLQGMRVKKGEMLVELQHPDYIQLQQDYLNQASQLQFLETEYNRQLELAKENVNAQKTLQQAKAQFQSMRATVQGLKSKLSLLNLSPEQLAENGIQSSIRLYSPINGFVTEVNINLGKYVSPADVMVRLVNMEHMHAELHVFEKDITAIHIGQHVIFHLVNDTTDRQAEIYLVGREISKDRTIRVHCHLAKEEDPTLLPGMFINAEIETDTASVTVLPTEAVITHEGKQYVFIPHGNGNEFKLTPVEASQEKDGFTVIKLSDKIKPDTKIVGRGAYTLSARMFNMEEEE